MQLRQSVGFTLIEVLVVVSILAMLMGGAIAAFASYRDRREVQIEALAVAERLRKVQVKASATEVPSGCNIIKSYIVAISGTDLSVRADCQSGTIFITELDLSLTKTVFAADKTVVFDSRTVAASAVDIDICGNSLLYRINVNAVGFVARPELVGSC